MGRSVESGRPLPFWDPPSNYCTTRWVRRHFSPRVISRSCESWRNCLRFLDRAKLGVVLSCTRRTCLTNAIPLENKREKRNDVGRKFMFWKQMHGGNCEDKNLERILKEDIGTSAQPESVERLRHNCRQLWKPDVSLPTCLRYAYGDMQRDEQEPKNMITTVNSTDGRSIPTDQRCRVPRRPCSVQASLQSPKLLCDRKHCPFW